MNPSTAKAGTGYPKPELLENTSMTASILATKPQPSQNEVKINKYEITPHQI